MSHVRTILIAAPELIPALRERIGGGGEMLTFADSEPLRAIDAVAKERPPIVAMERLFAASPRGAALISRIKSDPALDHCQILVLAHDSDYRRVSPRRRKPGSGAVKARAPQRFDTGTRRAVRIRMRAGVLASIDEDTARLVDLSTLGAQVLTLRTLKPGQDVSLNIDPAGSSIGASGVVIWASLELSGRRPQYRAGVEFRNADAAALTAFAEAHRAG